LPERYRAGRKIHSPENTDDERATFLAPAKPKLVQIYELMKKAEHI